MNIKDNTLPVEKKIGTEFTKRGWRVQTSHEDLIGRLYPMYGQAQCRTRSKYHK